MVGEGEWVEGGKGGVVGEEERERGMGLGMGNGKGEEIEGREGEGGIESWAEGRRGGRKGVGEP